MWDPCIREPRKAIYRDPESSRIRWGRWDREVIEALVKGNADVHRIGVEAEVATRPLATSGDVHLVVLNQAAAERPARGLNDPGETGILVIDWAADGVAASRHTVDPDRIATVALVTDGDVVPLSIKDAHQARVNDVALGWDQRVRAAV